MIRTILLSVSIILLSTSAYAEEGENSDGCENQRQACTCPHIAYPEGECDFGPIKPGLYCHCYNHQPLPKIAGEKPLQTDINFDECDASNLGQQCVIAGIPGTCRWVPNPRLPSGKMIACAPNGNIPEN